MTKQINLTIQNDLGQEFEYLCFKYEGYEVFQQAIAHWDYNWNTYKVFEGNNSLDNVINPLALDPNNAQIIH